MPGREASAAPTPPSEPTEAVEPDEEAEDVLAESSEESGEHGERPQPEPSTPDFASRETAAHARLGAEGVVRLRARYAELMARIAERIQDPARQEELKAAAERLNPDLWITEDEVRAGLEQYEAVYASLRGAVGRRNRRGRRRRSAGRGSPAPTQHGGDAAAEPAEDPGNDDL